MTQPSTPHAQRAPRSIARPIHSPEGSVTDLNAVATTRYERTCAVLQERAAMD